jgi:purine nucleoside phosphorylase
MGVDRILATNAVGSLDESIKPGDLVVPHDFWTSPGREETPSMMIGLFI